MKKNKRLELIRRRIPREIKATIDRSFEIVDRIDAILIKQNKTRKELADAMRKSESEISKWMRGTHNFTIKTICKLELVLGESIIAVPQVQTGIFTMDYLSGSSKLRLVVFRDKHVVSRENLIFTATDHEPISTEELILQYN